MKKNTKPRRLLALLLVLTLALGMIPLSATAASQENVYHDPAENWLEGGSRADTFTQNATRTYGTMQCRYCTIEQNGSVTQPYVYTACITYRVPEYTSTGVSDAVRNIGYSDGYTTTGETANVNYQSPNDGGIYTGYHWSKSMCLRCGRINTNYPISDHCYDRDVYILYDCASSFEQQTGPVETTWEYLDSERHIKTVTQAKYCGFCFDTTKTTDTITEPHNLEESIRPELAHDRFVIMDSCKDCEYGKTQYVLAKSVVANYEGVVDGQPHTITVSDLSEAGVTTQIRYGESAETCTLTSAPNYTEAGSYPVYYQITYTYDDVNMVEDGVAYVRLVDASGGNNDGSGCTCGCGNPNCDCQNPDCGGDCCQDSCAEGHNWVELEKVEPTCTALGYTRRMCVECGKVEKIDYVDSLGHAWQSVVIRDATCETPGKTLEICQRCGTVKEVDTPKGEHQYETFTVEASCTSPGYTVKECSVCGDRHVTNLTDALPHKYEARITEPGCETGGSTLHICEGCGSSFITDYTDPLGHAWDEGKEITSPTCNGAGVIQYTCTRCGLTRLEAQDATGHTPGPEATCTEPQICTICGAILELPTGHTPGDWIVDKEPTASEDGEKHQECVDCGEILDTEAIPKLGYEEHPYFMVGYPDGTFQPQGEITRAEAAALFANLLSQQKGVDIHTVANAGFSDIPANAWYSGHVWYLDQYGVISGVGDNKFAPEEPISRAEFTAMAVKFFNVYDGGDEDLKEEYEEFADIAPGYWAAKFIEEAALRGWISGYEDGSFRGENFILRAEAAAMVNGLLGREVDMDYVNKNVGSLVTFPDVPPTYWGYGHVMEATNAHDADCTGKNEVWAA